MGQGVVPVALLICGPKLPEMLQGKGLSAPVTCPQATRESLVLGSKADCTGGMGNAFQFIGNVYSALRRRK